MVCRSLFLIIPLLFAAGTPWVADADPPEPWPCEVHPADELEGVVLAPSDPQPIPASVLTILVRDLNYDPVPNAVVVVELHWELRLCEGSELTKLTNEDGIAMIALTGGGCLQQIPSACMIRANGVAIREYRNAKSPDFDGRDPSGRVDLADLVAFIQGGECHDYNNDDLVNLSDLVIFASGFSPQHSCQLMN